VKVLNIAAIESRSAELGLNQASLAERLGLSREAVSQWFKRNKFPRPAALLALSKILDLPFDRLVLPDTDPAVRYAYRTNRNQAVTPERERKAQDLASA
jgi:transcriptional regulator with XRE-family HTH domain